MVNQGSCGARYSSGKAVVNLLQLFLGLSNQLAALYGQEPTYEGRCATIPPINMRKITCAGACLMLVVKVVLCTSNVAKCTSQSDQVAKAHFPRRIATSVLS